MPVGPDSLEAWIIRLCPFIEALGYLGMSFSKTTMQYYASGVVVAMACMGPPALQSALTKHVAKEDVGRLLGALSLMGSLNRVVGPTVLSFLYSFTVKSCPQTVFYVVAGVMFIGFILTLGIRAHGMIILCYCLTTSEIG